MPKWRCFISILANNNIWYLHNIDQIDFFVFQNVSDLFPGVTLPKPDYKVLLDSLDLSLKNLKLQPHPWFIDKIVQVSMIYVMGWVSSKSQNHGHADISVTVIWKIRSHKFHLNSLITRLHHFIVFYSLVFYQITSPFPYIVSTSFTSSSITVIGKITVSRCYVFITSNLELYSFNVDFAKHIFGYDSYSGNENNDII